MSFDAQTPRPAPADMAERLRALDTQRSLLVRAPAGSGKTHLLTTRFLRLLAEVDDPREVVAITFTRAAAAEMRQRILSELKLAAETAQDENSPQPEDPLRAAARLALAQIRRREWNILEYPDQLRIQTIDSFCSSIAMRAPLHWDHLSGLGGNGNIATDSNALYRLAARRTLCMLDTGPEPLRAALRALFELRDTKWNDLEDLLCEMLASRARWSKDIVFGPEDPQQREQLEAPMLRAVRDIFLRITQEFHSDPEILQETMQLMRFAASNSPQLYPLAATQIEWPEIDPEEEARAPLQQALEFLRELGNFFLIKGGTWRKQVTVREGFPSQPDTKPYKARFLALVDRLRSSDSMHRLLQQAGSSLVAGYTEDEWQLVRHAIVAMRYASAQLQVVFMEEAALDYTEMAALAQRILERPDGSPSDFALDFAAGIRHLLIDEFQDTSRNQYQLIDSLVAAWPGDDLRTCFCVGDPMQSIYGFRDSDYELFDRPVQHGFGAEHDPTGTAHRIQLEPVLLTANFRSAPELIAELNQRMAAIFAPSQLEQIRFHPAVAARSSSGTSSATSVQPRVHLHLSSPPSQPDEPAREAAWLPIVREHLERSQELRRSGAGGKYRIALLARTGKVLLQAAQQLESAEIPYLATDLIPLSERMEILDAVSLAQAALHPQDRLAWASVLRAPWCGLSLAELHRLISNDDPSLARRPIPELIEERLPLLGLESDRAAVLLRLMHRILEAGRERHRATQQQMGSWLHRLWLAAGGSLATRPLQQRNLQILWTALDQLPRRELDLLERNPDSGWRSFLRKLPPQPDPELDPDFCVQLLTIHKAKGLEYEVVLLPELQRRGKNGQAPMLAWLERGDPRSEHLTEFLIAPIQSRGQSQGGALAWVMQQKQRREAAEEQRVFYVAATRAREQLHLFATPKANALQSLLNAQEPSRKPSLLQIVAPGFAQEITLAVESLEAAEAPVDASAPAAPALAVPQRLLRVDPAALLAMPDPAVLAADSISLDAAAEEPLYLRSQGGLHSRAQGTAVHLLLQHMARLRQSMPEAAARQQIAAAAPALAAQLRPLGLAQPEAAALAAAAVRTVLACAKDPVGSWILAPHAPAFTEASWTGQMHSADGRSRWTTVRPDRCFLASTHPLDGPDSQDGSSRSGWWILDYKTTGAALAGLAAQTTPPAPELLQFLAEHRQQFAPQLELYGELLARMLLAGAQPAAPIHLGIYYPLLRRLDHWQMIEPPWQHA